eukprot:scaffold136948_cov157-Phaeocystis_antarctica.AAC.1
MPTPFASPRPSMTALPHLILRPATRSGRSGCGSVLTPDKIRSGSSPTRSRTWRCGCATS